LARLNNNNCVRVRDADAPLLLITTRYYVATIIFNRRAWYRALSLRYACIRSSGIVLIPYVTFVPINFVSFAAAIAELAYEEKSRTQSLTQSPGLFDAPGTEACSSETVENFVMMM